MTKKTKKKVGKKNPGGRPTKYKEEYCEDMVKFFNRTTFEPELRNGDEYDRPCELPMLQDYADKIGVDFDTLKEWKKVHPKFSAAYKKCKEIQESIIAKNAMTGRYNTTFSIFMLKCNHNWVDRQVIEHREKTLEDAIREAKGE